VLRLTLLDNVSGLRWKHSNDAELRNVNVEPFIILDSGQVILPPAPAELFVVHRQKIAADKILTWLGLYRAVPNAVNNRKGDYCGVGFWLLNNTVAGSDATQILRGLMTDVFRSMQASGRQPWDVARAPTESMARSVEDPRLGDINARRDLGRDVICIDASSGGAHAIDDAIDEIQEDGDGFFDRFGRVLLSQDKAVLNAVESRGRIPVKKLSQIAQAAPAPVRDLRPGDDGAARSRSPSRATGLAAPRALTEGSSDAAGLSYEVRRLDARIDQFSKTLAEVQARAGQGARGAWSPLAVASILVSLAAVAAVGVLAFSGGAPAPPVDRTPALQARLDNVESQLKKLQETLAAPRSERPVAPTPPTPPPKPPLGDAADANAPPSAPPVGASMTASSQPPATNSRAVQPINTQDLATRFVMRDAYGDVAAPFILIDVDAGAHDRVIKGAQPCLYFAKAGKGQRCTVKDLKQFLSDDAPVIFYGHDMGPHAVAADLAVEMAAVPNVLWYRDGFDAWRKAGGPIEEQGQ
jgi:rhodanese-related sulfurtransferase